MRLQVLAYANYSVQDWKVQKYQLRMKLLIKVKMWAILQETLKTYNILEIK